MERLRLAILSATGTARKRVIPAVRERDLCSIVAVHGRNQDKLVALAKEHAIPRYFLDAEQMLDETTPDFVFIGSPPSLHHRQISMCVERNIPVLCEKPLCLKYGEAEEIRALFRNRSTPFRVAHHLRHQEGVSVLREMIANRTHGMLRRVSMQWGFWLNQAATNATWKLVPSTGGPHCFYDAGVHALDLMLHLLPPPTRLTSLVRGSRFSTSVDNVSVVLLCGEVLVELSASQSLRCPLNSLTLDFERACVYVPHAMGEASFPVMEVSSTSGSEFKSFPVSDLYGNEVRDFIRMLTGHTSCGATLDEACRAVQLLEAITASYTTERTVTLESTGGGFA